MQGQLQYAEQCARSLSLLAHIRVAALLIRLSSRLLYITFIDDCPIALMVQNFGHSPCCVRMVNRDRGGNSKGLGVNQLSPESQ